MYRLGQCDLVYINQSQDESGNPVINKLNRTIKCTLMESFSANYYFNQSRDMRNTKNIIVAKPYIFDLTDNDNVYHLEFVNFNGRKYKIRNILNNRKSAITSILDCDEIINE